MNLKEHPSMTSTPPPPPAPDEAATPPQPFTVFRPDDGTPMGRALGDLNALLPHVSGEWCVTVRIGTRYGVTTVTTDASAKLADVVVLQPNGSIDQLAASIAHKVTRAVEAHAELPTTKENTP
jgi:hypothetical protein